MPHPDDPIQGEAQIIAYFRPLARSSPGALNLEDDAAILTSRTGFDLVLTTDAVAAGVHFFADESPELIAWRALAVNVSDLAAKGAMPVAYLMGLAFPQAPTHGWLCRFADGLKVAQDAFGIELLGGDTDRRDGPLTVNITAIGEVPAGTMVKRAGAKVGDRLYVSGTPGDSALGLYLRLGSSQALALAAELSAAHRRLLLDRYGRPQPRLELAAALKLAHASMDISDGLPKDLARMCKAAHLGAQVQLASLPKSQAAQSALLLAPALRDTWLAGGDDYEILAAVPAANADEFEATGAKGRIPLTCIGEITRGDSVEFLDAAGSPVTLAKSGYDHF